jgi:hypothetical protein
MAARLKVKTPSQGNLRGNLLIACVLLTGLRREVVEVAKRILILNKRFFDRNHFCKKKLSSLHFLKVLL